MRAGKLPASPQTLVEGMNQNGLTGLPVNMAHTLRTWRRGTLFRINRAFVP